MTRGPGTFGTIGVRYTAVGRSAIKGDDFRLEDGEVLIMDGTAGSSINVTIVDDGEREYEEIFELRLLAATGGFLISDNVIHIPVHSVGSVNFLF